MNFHFVLSSTCTNFAKSKLKFIFRMAIHPLWRDEYWLLLMQLYLRKPVGVKPLYSKALVNLSMELHIAPQVLYQQMFRLRQIDTPQMEKLWAKYGKNPRKLSKEVALLRKMDGYGAAGLFYEGVVCQELLPVQLKKPNLTIGRI